MARGWPYPEEVVLRARALRSEGLSITRVAQVVGAPRSTVGGWLQGFGETREYRTCWCGETFLCSVSRQRSCCVAHRNKRWAIWGPINY